MSRHHWLQQLDGSSRPATTSGSRQPARPAIRQLERRRVLDAAAPAILISPIDTTEGDTVAVSADAAGIDSPQFDWTVTVDAVVIATSNQALFEFTPADDGTYTVDLVVTDASLQQFVATRDVAIGNANPRLEVTSLASVAEGSQLVIRDLGTISDAGFDDATAGTQETFLYNIDWGDGTADNGSATIDRIGTAGIDTLASFDGIHTYADNGVYTVRVVVLDDDGGRDTGSFQVFVSNVDPTVTAVGDQTAVEGVELSLPDIATISDPAFGNPAIPSLETFTYSINWGDGSPPDTGSATIDQFGRAGQATLASLDGAHIYAAEGTYTVTISVLDDDGGLGSDQFDVVVVNAAPTLVAAGDQSVAEGAELVVTDIGTVTDLAFAPAEGDQITYTIDWGDGSDPDVGVATIDQLGDPGEPTFASFDGTHIYADNGVYTVILSVDDGDGGTASDTLTVEVGNVAPTLTVADDQTAREGTELTIVDIGRISDPAFISVPLANGKAFEFSIDWGDGTGLDSGFATIDSPGTAGTPTLASFDGVHTYADNGVYTVTVRVADDDGGVAQQTLLVTVENVAPELTGTAGLVLDEGQVFTLADLGVGLSDPGFDNPLNTEDPTNGGQLTETFTATTIDWGDGSPPVPVNIVNRVSGAAGTATTAEFDHAPHAYADNGAYTVQVNFADDDGGVVSAAFVVTVNNVSPTLTLTTEAFTINEGETLVIPLLGTFTDPGFDNPLRPGGASTETFTYEITWDDGNATEVGVLPVSTTSGAQGVLTVGTLADSNFYADNNPGNVHTITVKLLDDDGGFAEQSFDITVLNVAPTLLPITAIDVTSEGNTEVTLSFSDPGADEFDILVAWGEDQHLSLDERWMVEVHYDGATPVTFVLPHHYDGPPNPEAISADIPISVVIRDDDFASASTLAIGQSNIETVLIGQPGTEDAKFAIDTTPEIPVIEFPRLEEAVIRTQSEASNVGQTDTLAFESGGSELAASTERYFRLHVVMPDGQMLEGIRLPDDALADLPALFARLPDNHYRIYLVRGDSGSVRLVLDVVVRDHRPVDPADASDGTRDRPPTDTAPTPIVDDPAGPQASVIDSEPTDQVDAPPAAAAHTGSSAAIAAAALVLNPKTDWAVRLERAFARADRRRWQSLRRRRPR